MAKLQFVAALWRLCLLRSAVASYQPYTFSPSNIVLTPTSFVPYPTNPASIPGRCSQHATNSTQLGWTTQTLSNTASRSLPTVVIISTNSTNTTYHSPTLTSETTTQQTTTQQTVTPTTNEESSSIEIVQPTSTPDQPATSTAPSEPLFTAGAARDFRIEFWQWTWGLGILVGGIAVGM